MSGVTDADRERASEVLFGLSSDPGVLQPHDARRIERVAAALAEEREKARAPFQRLAAEFAQQAGDTMDHEAFCAWSDAEGMVLRAAETESGGQL